MSDSAPLYNSRIPKIYIQCLSKFYPDIDLDAVLTEAGIARYEIEDPAHWFTQENVDRLHDILVARTGNPNIAREAVGQQSLPCPLIQYRRCTHAFHDVLCEHDDIVATLP